MLAISSPPDDMLLEKQIAPLSIATLLCSVSQDFRSQITLKFCPSILLATELLDAPSIIG